MFVKGARNYPDSKVHGANMGPSGADRTQMGPMLAPWTLLSGYIYIKSKPTKEIRNNLYIYHKNTELCDVSTLTLYERFPLRSASHLLLPSAAEWTIVYFFVRNQLLPIVVSGPHSTSFIRNLTSGVWLPSFVVFGWVVLNLKRGQGKIITVFGGSVALTLGQHCGPKCFPCAYVNHVRFEGNRSSVATAAAVNQKQ